MTTTPQDVSHVYAWAVEIPLGDLLLLRQRWVLEPSLVLRADQVHQGTDRVGGLSANGVAAAVTNAVFDATGRRVRDLPITPDKLLAALL
ncbi:hypothetical protein ACFRAO_31650 [Streptomyces sp. NPDC056656]|uniref:hypothetical protein n=1 Tax=Streptomyces sp. NPDC056656 TaxID=3345895 RepID=UPI0036A88082